MRCRRPRPRRQSSNWETSGGSVEDDGGGEETSLRAGESEVNMDKKCHDKESCHPTERNKESLALAIRVPIGWNRQN